MSNKRLGQIGYQKHPDPTPAEIRQECERMQSTWTDYERWRRSRGFAGRIPKDCNIDTVPPSVETQVVSLSDMGVDFGPE